MGLQEKVVCYIFLVCWILSKLSKQTLTTKFCCFLISGKFLINYRIICISKFTKSRKDVDIFNDFLLENFTVCFRKEMWKEGQMWWGGNQGSWGIRLCSIVWGKSLIMLHKIAPYLDQNCWLNSLDPRKVATYRFWVNK